MHRLRSVFCAHLLLEQNCGGIVRRGSWSRRYLWPCTTTAITSSSNGVPGFLSAAVAPFLFSSHYTTDTSVRMMRRFITMASGSLSSSPVAAAEENGRATEENYENAIRTLNTLQSNAATLAKVREDRELRRKNGTSISQTIACIIQSGLTLEDIDKLDIVHVAGTKGKGMTCAFTESILRQAGLKTGFFSSPHLTAVRERIRIDGRPLSEEHFAKTFFSVYHNLEHLQDPEEEHACEMPHYFRFLMVMAFHAFVEEKVDVVVLEVGIGGSYDTTNFIRQPTVVGISSLGLEHQNVLGYTLEDIAAQKAGIMKEGVPAYTVNSHPPEIQQLLRERAKEVGCPLTIVQPLDLSGIDLGVGDGAGGVSSLNAGLAINLANELLLKKHSHIFPRLSGAVTSAAELQYTNDPTLFLPFQLRGLQLIRWDGRFQKIQDSQTKKVTYFLDGAHTVDSLKRTLQWFSNQSSATKSLRLLVFNITGERNSAELLAPLVAKDTFDLAIFCPMVASTVPTTSADNWSALEDEKKDVLEGCRKVAKVWEDIQDRSKGVVLASAEETLEYIRELAKGEQYRVSVLITGSLHLVGTFLTVLQPNRNDV